MECKRACKCDPLWDFRFVHSWLSSLPNALHSEFLLNRGSCIHPGFSLNRTEKCSTLPSLWINWKPSDLIKCLLAQIQARCRNSTWPTSGSRKGERGCLLEKRDPSFALAPQPADLSHQLWLGPPELWSGHAPVHRLNCTPITNTVCLNV